MATVKVNDILFAYDELGERGRPTIVFAHSLVWDREMFAEVVSDLASHFHIINLDQHGHGESGYPASFSLEDMARDFGALLDLLGLDAVHWAGLSLGGMTGLRLALQRPEKIRSLILMDTSSRPEMAERKAQYLQLAAAIRDGRASQVADQVLPFFFCETTYKEKPELVASYCERFMRAQDREGLYQAALAVFHRGDITDELPRISAPTLVLVGADDISTPPDRAQLIAERIPNARLTVIADAGHMSASEQPQPVAAAMREFLQTLQWGSLESGV